MKIGNIDIADIKLGDSQVSAWLGGVLVWGGGSPTPPGPQPWHLCFTAEQANSTVKLNKQGAAPSVELRYSTDGSSWNQFQPGTTVVSLPNVGDKVWIVAGPNGNERISGGNNSYYYFVMTGKIAASGNVMSLLDSNQEIQVINGFGLLCLFQKCTSLTQAPELPATTLAPYCYASMFYNCTSLTQAPALPATTLAERCYLGMFSGCSSLTTAPELPATTLAGSCYSSMFKGCTNLSSMNVGLSAWASSDDTTNWLSGVAATGTFTCPAELSDIRDASHIPVGWNVVHPAAYPTQDLKLHFDAIDNGGVGNHLSSTTEWANIAPDTSATYKLVRTQGSWEDDSAVFTGAANECFWLNTSAGTQVANFSQTGLVLSSQTYEIAFYFDPTTCQNYRGYVGKQLGSGAGGGGQIYIACDNTNSVNVLVSGKNANEGGAQWWSGDNSLNMYPYLTQNAFNTIAVSWDEATTMLTLYVNGQKIGDATSPRGITHGTVLTNPLALGGGMQQTGSNRVCKGKIHDFLIYSRALSDAEVAQLHDYQDARFNS